MKPSDICCIASQWFQHSFHCPQHLNDRDLWIARGPLNCLCLGHSPPPLITPKPKKTRTLFKLNFDPQVMAVAVRGPAGVPPDRFDALRKAFTETTHDKEFLADAAKAKFEICAVSGLQIQELLQEIYATPHGSRAQDRGIAAKIRP